MMAKDNIDVNAKSNFVTSHFHGTSTTIVQHITCENRGQHLPEPEMSSSSTLGKSRKLAPLPEKYSKVQDILPHTKDDVIRAPLCLVNVDDLTSFPQADDGLIQEVFWIEKVSDDITQNMLSTMLCHHY